MSQVITEADLGWTAGVLDMHGHVVRHKNKTRARGSVQVSVYVETSLSQVTDKLCALTGSSAEPMNAPKRPEEWDRRGCIEHCPEPHIHTRFFENLPQVTRWAVAGASCAVVLWNLQGRLVTKGEPWEWALAMSLASTRLSGQGSGAALAAIRRLHALGWEVPSLMREAVSRDAGAKKVTADKEEEGT